MPKKNPAGKSDWSITKLWKEEFQQPSSMAAIWTYDELVAQGRPAERGFGGRIYFYNERSQAIPVDGDLMVHGYVTTPKYAAEDKVAPDKKFEFPAEKLSAHFSPSDIGASYSIWVPWDALGGFREEITLIPTFKSKDGALVQGTPAKLFLKGKARDPAHLEAPSIQQVSYQNTTGTGQGSEADTLKRNAKTRTTTIGLLDRPRTNLGDSTLSSIKSQLTSHSKGKRQIFTLASAPLAKTEVQPKIAAEAQSNSGSGTLKSTLLPNLDAKSTPATGTPMKQGSPMPSDTSIPGSESRGSYELRSLQAPTLPPRTPTASLPSVRDLEKGILSNNGTRGITA